MSRVLWFAAFGLAGLLAAASSAPAQTTPYIGYVYPAGGQRGTTFQIRLGGQRLTGLSDVVVSGPGVTAKVVEFYRKMGNQELTLIREQAKLLRQEVARKTKAKKKVPQATREMIAQIDKRISMWVNRPACSAHSELAIVEVTMAPDAEPGSREIRLVAQRGVTNPLVFHVGQVPEVARKPMKTCVLQVLGKEHLALRKRPPEEEEAQITVPCTMNGQIASGEVNRYRFEAKQGQRLVISAHARQLIPYIADAVPGWFQPVLVLHDAAGKEVAFNDDFRFKPDPTLYFEVPDDGQYVLTVKDAIYRGREDFVYRVTVGEVPFVTSIFPLGGRVGKPAQIAAAGWNLEKAKMTPPPQDASPGVHLVTAIKDGFTSNSVPFALDTLPECLDRESNDNPTQAQKVARPIIVNGRMDRPDDWDVFAVEGRAGETIVVEVQARRLDSPMDSMLKITDADGKLLALNDDHSDPGSGVNTHHADSYLMVELPSDGTYFIHLGDTARGSGKEYAYRLRISDPRPDFELRVAPSSAVLRSKGGGALNVYAIRKDGFDGDIKLRLKDAPEGFNSWNVTLPKAKGMVKFGMKTTLAATDKPLTPTIEGFAVVDGQEIVHAAVPADDRMQAFLWRHLVCAEELALVVYDPTAQPSSTRVPPPLSDEEKARFAPTDPTQIKFSKGQVAGRLRQLKLLYEEWLLTDEFYARKVAQCESVL
ncbi:MAG: hypothetical protein HQ567_06320 [Candidatus Nealsonbacteria bacterium]|nr:hypothetical protein [Candidatus Nealsonbacteria bacterium]